MPNEGEQIKQQQQRLDKLDKKVDQKVVLAGKDHADTVLKKVDNTAAKLESNFGIKEQIVLDSPKFKEAKDKAFGDIFKILREIDEKNVDELVRKLDEKLSGIAKELATFNEEEKKVTKVKNDLTDFNTYMQKRRDLEKKGKFKEAENLTAEYNSTHINATEKQALPETANFKNTLGDAEKITELLRVAQVYIDQANAERKFEQQEGFRVGYILQGPNPTGNGDALDLPSDLVKITDQGEKSPITNLAAIVEINPEKGVRLVMTHEATEATKTILKEFGVTDGWIKPADLRKAIAGYKMKFSHCEEGTTRCVTPKMEGKSVETEAKAKEFVEEANVLKIKIELSAIFAKTTITSKRAMDALSANILCKDGKLSFTPKFLVEFEKLTLDQKKQNLKLAQESLLNASIIEAAEKSTNPVAKQFYAAKEALANGDLPGARFKFTRFLEEASTQKDTPKEMIKFAKEKVKEFNIASIKRLQKINDQLYDFKRYEGLLKDPANSKFLYFFIQKNKENLAAQLQQIEAGTFDTKAQRSALIQRKEQTISATRVSAVTYGGVEKFAEKDNRDQLMNAWNSLVYAEFSTATENDNSKIQDEYLSAARTLRKLGQPDLAEGYFESAMKDDIARVRGTISKAQTDQMRAKIIEANETKRSTYETTIRQKIWKETEEFNAKLPPEFQKPLEISAEDLKALVDAAMAEGVEEQIKKVVMHGMAVANDKGELEKGSKKAWSEYESMLDVNEKWYIISDAGAEKIAEQIFIHGVIMALSGGVGALAAASVRAFMIANGIRSGLALGAAGFMAESTGFELANRAINTAVLHEKGLFIPAELAKGIGHSMLMFGSIAAGNKAWRAVSEAGGLATKTSLAARAADYTGQLATEAGVFTLTSENSYLESVGDIIYLRIGGKLVSPVTKKMHEASRKIIEEGVKRGKEKAEKPESLIDTVRDFIRAKLKGVQDFVKIKELSRKVNDWDLKKIEQYKHIYGNNYEIFKEFVKVGSKKHEHGLEILADLEPVYRGNLEVLQTIAYLVRDNPYSQLHSLIPRVKEIYGNDIEMFTEVAFAMRKVVYRDHASILIEAHAAYGNSKLMLGEFVKLINANNYVAFQILVAAKKVYGNNEELFLRVQKEILELNTDRQGILSNVRSLYEDNPDNFYKAKGIIANIDANQLIGIRSFTDNFKKTNHGNNIEIFEGFLEVYETSGIIGINVLRAMNKVYGTDVTRFQEVKAEVIKAGKDDQNVLSKLQGVASMEAINLEFFKEFVEVEKSIGCTQHLAAMHNLYGNNIEMLRKVKQEIVSMSVNPGNKAIETLALLHPLYDKDFERFLDVKQEIINLCTELPGGNFTIPEFLSAAQPLYDNSFSDFKKVTKLLSDSHSIKRSSLYNNLPRLTDTANAWNTNFEIFKIFVELAEDPRTESKIKSLAKASTVYGSNMKLFSEFVDIAKVADTIALDTMVSLKDVYGDNFELFLKMKNKICEMRESGELLDIYEDLVILKDTYIQSYEKFEVTILFLEKTKTVGLSNLEMTECMGMAKKFVTIYLEKGEKAATEYLENFREKAKGILNGRPLSEEVRAQEDFNSLIAYVYPKGNYSSHKQNAQNDDQTGHLAEYTFDQNGYAAKMSGLLGYKLVEGKTENPELLEAYSARLDKIRQFVQSRGPDNKALQQAFEAKVSGLFDALPARWKIGSEKNPLTVKEKMIALLLEEVVRVSGQKSTKPNTDVLDLLVEFKYAYLENLEEYIHRSASDAQRYKDKVSQNFSLWRELSTIYGENMKHVLRHDIFEYLDKDSKHRDAIENIFNQAVTEAAALPTVISLNTAQVDGIRVEFDNTHKSNERKYEVLSNLAIKLFGEDLHFDDPKTGESFKQEILQAMSHCQKPEHFNPDFFFNNIVPKLQDVRSKYKEFATRKPKELLNDKQTQRIRETFSNERIPADKKFDILAKQVREIFMANVTITEKEVKAKFEDDINKTLELMRASQHFNPDFFFKEIAPKLGQIRQRYAMNLSGLIDGIFANDIRQISQEVAKYDEVVEMEKKETQMGGVKGKEVVKKAKERQIRSFFMKTKESSNCRMGAYICIAGDGGMWKNPNYFEMVMKDEGTGKSVGLVMLLKIKAKDGKKYLWFGPNPYESFLAQVSSEQAYRHMYETVTAFAATNGFDGVVIPSRDEQILGGCTNRGGDFPDLIKASRLRSNDGKLKIVQYGERQQLGGSYGYEDGALVWERKADRKKETETKASKLIDEIKDPELKAQAQEIATELFEGKLDKSSGRFAEVLEKFRSISVNLSKNAVELFHIFDKKFKDEMGGLNDITSIFKLPGIFIEAVRDFVRTKFKGAKDKVPSNPEGTVLTQDRAVESVESSAKTHETQELYRILGEKGFGPYLQMLAAYADFNSFNGERLTTIQSRIDFISQFERATHYGREIHVKISPEHAAYEHLKLNMKSHNNWPLHHYIAQKIGVTSEYAKQIIERRFNNWKDREINFDRFFTNEVIDFLKNTEFEQSPPESNLVQYKARKTVLLPDSKGEMKKFTVQYTYQGFVVLSFGNLEFKIAKGFVDKYNKPKLGDLIYTAEKMFGDVVFKIEWNAKLALTIINLRGDLYPAFIQGKMRWMLKPNAHVTMDPHQDESMNHFGSDNKYNKVFEDLLKQGKKYILEEDLPSGAPSVKLEYGGIMMLNHHRLQANRRVPIEIKLTDFSTFN